MRPNLPKSRCGATLLGAVLALLAPDPGAAAVYYVRATVGNDANDGLSPQAAWKRFGKLRDLRAGDTAYVGPGLYRDGIDVQNDGTAEARITLIADSSGRYTGDPPGLVMVTGAEAVDEAIFTPTGVAGVYTARVAEYEVLGLTEMDGAQYRYQRARSTKEHLVDKLTEREVVEKLRSHYYYDEKGKTLYIHTSDDRPPRTHEIELFRRGHGVMVHNKHFVTVIGFTFRHVGDAGINFFKGSSDCAALFNTAYGSRQGIRVYGASNILVYGNTFFRNENSGVYFALGSTNGTALRNVAYENIKGIRWGSKSVSGVGVENVLFENRDAGISIEDTRAVTLRGNVLAGNHLTQLGAVGAEFQSDDNCFEPTDSGQLLADFYPYPLNHRFKSLREYQAARSQDLGSRENGCPARPAKQDVNKMHADTMSYRERALKAIERSVTPPMPAATPTVTPQRPAR